MIGKYIRLIGSVVVLLAFVLFITFKSGIGYKNQAGTVSLQETLQTSVQENRAVASRVSRGVYIIDRQTFENSVRNKLSNTTGGGKTNLDGVHIKFAYLTDRNASKLNSKVVDSNLGSTGVDLTNSNSRYIAIKGIRVLADLNQNGIYNDKGDLTATEVISTNTKIGEQ